MNLDRKQQIYKLLSRWNWEVMVSMGNEDDSEFLT